MHRTAPIRFFFQDTRFTLRDRTRLKRSLAGIFKREKKVLESLNYIFCTDQALLKINREYLNHNYFTDIITFELSPKGSPINAEIYISIDRVRENSNHFGVTLREELTRVMIHGVLHLCGYKDKSKKDISTMRIKEAYYLKGAF